MDAPQMEDEATMRYLIAVMAATMIFSAGCAKKEAPKPAAKAGDKAAPGTDKARQAAGQEQDAVQHKILAFNLEGLTDKGEKKWDVKGESAEATSENEVKLDNIVAKAYGDEAEAVITADKGVYDKTKNNVRLQQNVKATIEATQGFSGSFVDAGQGRAAGSEGDKKTSKKTRTIITCDGEVEFDYEKNIAFFIKNVHVDSEDGSIVADKITVHLDPETRQVKEIVADGNVKIKREENVTYSERATYDAVSKKISLTGRPKLVIYQEGNDVNTSFMGGITGKK